jgi:phosphinothricin acetyltransferase
MLIRHADPAADAAACAAIYEPYVAASVISLEATPPGRDEFRQRIEKVSASYPWLIAEDDGQPAGFAYASLHRERAAYRWACVYIDQAYHRRGIGRTLYETLFGLLRRQGLQVVCAGVTLPNSASVALHESFGFELVGIYRRIGWKAGSWHDVGWWELELVAPTDGPPPEPGPPARLDQR